MIRAEYVINLELILYFAVCNDSMLKIKQLISIDLHKKWTCLYSESYVTFTAQGSVSIGLCFVRQALLLQTTLYTISVCQIWILIRAYVQAVFHGCYVRVLLPHCWTTPPTTHRRRALPSRSHRQTKANRNQPMLWFVWLVGKSIKVLLPLC